MEQPDADAKVFEDFAALPSTLQSIGIDLTGFLTEELARTVGQQIDSWLQIFSRVLNLTRLQRVVVAYNYEEALARVDRGTNTNRTLTPTK